MEAEFHSEELICGGNVDQHYGSEYPSMSTPPSSPGTHLQAQTNMRTSSYAILKIKLGFFFPL